MKDTKRAIKPIPVARPQYAGAFTVHDAALYLRATTPPRRPLRLSVLGASAGFAAPSSHRIASWVREILDWPAPNGTAPSVRLLTFSDLIRLKMYVLLRTRGLSFHAIRAAENYARQLTGSPQPFVTEPIWSNSSDVFVKFAERLVSASRHGQLAMDFLWDYVDAVKTELRFDDSEVVEAWSPSPQVLIDPEVEFGAPCITGTRIQTEVLWSLVSGGNTIEQVAEMYAIGREKVEAALAWEHALADAA